MLKLKSIEKYLYTFIFLIIGGGVILSKTNHDLYRSFYVIEDGLTEWMTVFALFIGMLMCWYRIFVLKPFRSTLFLLSLGFMGLVLLFGIGEEISWGQRIFNIQSGDFFVANNSQGETNLHNLVVGGTKINKLIFGKILGLGTILYFFLLPFLYKKFAKIKELCDELAIHVPKYFHGAFILVAYGLSHTAASRQGELVEFGLCWIAVLMMYEPLNREFFSRRSHER